MQALLRDLMNGNEELTAQLHKEREISQSKSKLVESLYI